MLKLSNRSADEYNEYECEDDNKIKNYKGECNSCLSDSEYRQLYL